MNGLDTLTAKPTPAFYVQEVGAEGQPPPEYTITTWPEAGFQRCPICNGQGVVPNDGFTGLAVSKKCPVCEGKMIINCKTGKPPES